MALPNLPSRYRRLAKTPTCAVSLPHPRRVCRAGDKATGATQPSWARAAPAVLWLARYRAGSVIPVSGRSGAERNLADLPHQPTFGFDAVPPVLALAAEGCADRGRVAVKIMDRGVQVRLPRMIGGPARRTAQNLFANGSFGYTKGYAARQSGIYRACAKDCGRLARREGRCVPRVIH